MNEVQEQVLTVTAENRELNVAPGSVVHIRDEEWLVTSAEKSVDGTLVRPRLSARSGRNFWTWQLTMRGRC